MELENSVMGINFPTQFHFSLFFVLFQFENSVPTILGFRKKGKVGKRLGRRLEAGMRKPKLAL